MLEMVKSLILRFKDCIYPYNILPIGLKVGVPYNSWYCHDDLTLYLVTVVGLLGTIGGTELEESNAVFLPRDYIYDSPNCKKSPAETGSSMANSGGICFVWVPAVIHGPSIIHPRRRDIHPQ